MRCFGYREFCRLWSEVVPFICTMPPAEDICHICQENATQIMQSANCGEDEKGTFYWQRKSISSAKKQRCHYQKQAQESPVPQDFQRQENEMEQHDMDVAPKSGKRLCSHCRLPGHTKTKRGKITCPKLL